MRSDPAHKARQHYNIDHWSEGYFQINDSGGIDATFSQQGRPATSSVTAVVEEAMAQGAELPLLIRFKPILRHRVLALKEGFYRALTEQGCEARYLPVYPVKVNQERAVVEELLSLGETRLDAARGGTETGLEVGSKAELVLAMTMGAKCLAGGGEGLTVICNGFKDADYIRLALMARRCGLNTFIVIEKPYELDWVIALAEELGVKPLLGIRVRLNTQGKSNWQNSGGEKSKFGVTTSELLKVVQRLAENGISDCLQLMHFHLGSQISHIGDIQAGVKEAVRYYAELVNLGLPINALDIGGGLGVDYEGSRTRNYCSMNYSLSEYAHTVVHAVKEVCGQYEIAFPNLITEAGRAMAAHHAVLVVEVLANEQGGGNEKSTLGRLESSAEKLNAAYQKIFVADQFELLEIYHQVSSDYQDIQSKFLHGVIGLEAKAMAETLYSRCCVGLIRRLDNGSKARQEARRELLKKTPHKTLLNFSLFRSLPDVWGIDQIFPVMPLQNLQQELTEQSVLQDITCDSDGRIDQYIEGENIEATFSMAKENAQPGSLMGIFLVGAYQEILGDNHNLFGKTDAVTVDFSPQGRCVLDEVTSGDTIQSVLREVNYEAQEIKADLATLVAQLPPKEREDYLQRFEASLQSGTYLSRSGDKRKVFFPQ